MGRDKSHRGTPIKLAFLPERPDGTLRTFN